jgi:hypothetical protein
MQRSDSWTCYIFIGVRIEGDSGFVNLMRIKATYFEKVMEDKLLKEIKEGYQKLS